MRVLTFLECPFQNRQTKIYWLMCHSFREKEIFCDDVTFVILCMIQKNDWTQCIYVEEVNKMTLAKRFSNLASFASLLCVGYCYCFPVFWTAEFSLSMFELYQKYKQKRKITCTDAFEEFLWAMLRGFILGVGWPIVIPVTIYAHRWLKNRWILREIQTKKWCIFPFSKGTN